MSLSLISNAYAEGAAPAAGAQGAGGLGMIPFFFILVFFVYIIWSQSKRNKQQKAMIEALQKGDEVVTNGGLIGRVEKVGDNYLGIEVADNVVVQIQRSAVQSVLPKGTIKSGS
jgi:preprotein translocase subunit YajC